MKKLAIKLYEFLKRKFMFLKRKIISPSLPNNADGKTYINLGCALNSGKEFTNIDVEPYPNIHYIQDITDLSNFNNNSVDMVYASHVVEHIPKEKLKSTLLEWKRVLKSGGIFRFAVPDFDALTHIYVDSGRNINLVRDQIMGQNPPYHNHYTLWNFDFAKQLLEDIGYKNVRIWDYKNVDHHDFIDRSSRTLRVGDDEIPFSLNIEASK